MISRNQSLGWSANHSSRLAVGLLISENSANWLTIRGSIDGGSRNATNGLRASSSNSRRLRNVFSISTVTVSDPSAFRMRFSRDGNEPFVSTKLTVHTQPSSSIRARFDVAKCRATNGE